MDDYDWAALDWLEGQCMDGYEESRECYPDPEEDSE